MKIEEPVFFKNQSAFRKWLKSNHGKSKEITVGYYKVDSGKPSITYKESVDEALCFGWIDGIRRSLGAESYTIRFTPRNPKSIWSAVNIKRVNELKETGQMQPAGLKVFEERDVKKSKLYSFEQKNVKLSADYEKQFRKNKKAWEFFESQPPSYRTPAMWWIMSAKQEETQKRRLEILIADSGNGLRIAPLRRSK
jgi:uncharacterized protein YdeI (YjbR/CyaY-like superfamily)